MSVKFGYKSLQDTAGTTVTSGNAAVTYPIASVVDWLPFDYFKPDAAAASVTIKFYNASGQTADYVALAKHDLSGARVTVEYSADDVTYSTALAATTLADDGVFFKAFPAQAAKYWKLTFNRADEATIQPMIGMVFIGDVFDTGKGAQIGFDAPLLSGDDGSMNISMSGAPLVKRVKKQAISMPLTFKNLTPGWVRTNWLPLMVHIQKKPCIVSWDDANYEGDAVLAWVNKSSDLPLPNYSNATYVDVDIKLTAVLA